MDSYDELLLTEPTLIREGTASRARIIGRKRDSNGNLVGTYDPYPILNTRIYLAEFPDGHIVEYSANIIAKAIYNSLNDDGIEELLFKEIVAHRSNVKAITKLQAEELRDKEKENVKIRSSNNRHLLHTTQGWEICVMWQDGSTTWHLMIDIKHSFPLHLAEYCIQNKMHDEPAFAWWVK